MDFSITVVALWIWLVPNWMSSRLSPSVTVHRNTGSGRRRPARRRGDQVQHPDSSRLSMTISGVRLASSAPRSCRESDKVMAHNLARACSDGHLLRFAHRPAPRVAARRSRAAADRRAAGSVLGEHDGSCRSAPSLLPKPPRLADRWLEATAAGETRSEKRTTGRLAALVSDPAGLELAVRFVDRCPAAGRARRARELAAWRRTAKPRAASSASSTAPCSVWAPDGPVLPTVVVPAARIRLRQLVGHLVADAGPGLRRTSLRHGRRVRAQPQPAG